MPCSILALALPFPEQSVCLCAHAVPHRFKTVWSYRTVCNKVPAAYSGRGTAVGSGVASSLVPQSKGGLAARARLGMHWNP